MEKAVVSADIHSNWLNIIRALQAACTDNNGLAVVSVSVGVAGNEPICWFDPELSKIHPMRLAKARLDPKIARAIIAMTAHKSNCLPVAAEANTID